jgi:GDPmannose 4,6-dehydratase
MPDEIYNLAAQSFVGASFEQPINTTDISGVATTRILELIRQINPKTRFYQASTSELYGKVQSVPQNELTAFCPRSPYAVAKLYAYWITINYREAYKIFACNGILFNHESPIRGETFVTRKITYSLARIRFGIQDVIYLGNIDARRDWGYAKDYVLAMWLILQQEKADDYIIATGKVHSVRDFIHKAALIAGFEIEWQGKGINEVGRDKKTGKVIVRIDPRYYRPSEVEVTCGDATKARQALGWEPEVTFDQLVEIMMEKDLELLS